MREDARRHVMATGAGITASQTCAVRFTRSRGTIPPMTAAFVLDADWGAAEASAAAVAPEGERLEGMPADGGWRFGGGTCRDWVAGGEAGAPGGSFVDGP